MIKNVGNSMKKYQVIANQIRERILSGVYPPKTMIPDQKQFAEEFDVSMITVKKALDGLAREGLIFKKSGLGTFVLGKIPLGDAADSPANAFDGLSAQQGADHVESVPLLFELAFPTAEIAEKLDCKTSEPIYDILRLRKLNGKPFILEHTYMPVRLVPDLTKEILTTSIYQYIHNDLKLVFGGAYRKIHASEPTELDQQYLDAGEHTPMLEVEQVVWLTNGENVEYSTSRNVFDQRSYTVIDVNDF